MNARFRFWFDRLWLAAFVVTELLGLWQFHGRWLWNLWVPHVH